MVIEPWILITFGAALAQSIRFMFQKQLTKAGLSAAGATFARFVFAAPFVVAGAALYARSSGFGMPQMPPVFWVHVVVGGTSQILATVAVVALFAHRNFAVGITFKKTEVLLSVLVGFVVLGDTISPMGLVAVLIGLAGVLLLADAPQATGAWRKRIFNRAVGLGLLSGLFFGISGVSYRGASLSLVDGDTFYRAIVTLAFVIVFQLVTMWIWLVWREAGQVRAVLKAWKGVSLVGLFSMLGTICWFSAFTLQTAGYVNAVGQVELLFSLIIGALVFGETVSKREWQGLSLLTASIVLLVLFA